MSSLRALGEALRFCNTSVDLNRVHPLVRFLVSARICVIFMTVYAVSIGGLLAYLAGSFDPLLFTVILVLFVLLHLADNLLNDLSDYGKGIDTSGYVRVSYAPHPVMQGLLSTGVIKGYVAVSLFASALLALYLGLTRSPLVPILAGIGGFIMLGYSGIPIDLKRLGLGELGVFIVWGVVMAGGTYTALTGRPPVMEALIYAPYGIVVSLVLIGKHLDKYEMDRMKGVKTLPVRLGFGRTLLLARVISISAPILAVSGIYLYTGSPLALLVLLAYPASYTAYRAFTLGRPREKPMDWRIWPLWFAAWSYLALDALGRYLVLSLLSIVLYHAMGIVVSMVVVVFTVVMGIKDLKASRWYIERFLSGW